MANPAQEVLQTGCQSSTFHLVAPWWQANRLESSPKVQVIVILAGLNDLIWLFQWWTWPEGASPAPRLIKLRSRCEERGLV